MNARFIALIAFVGWAVYPALANDGFPGGSIAFFDNGACPQGWQPYGPARGRAVLPAAPASDLGGVVGKPLGPREKPRHSHRFEAAVLLGAVRAERGNDPRVPALMAAGAPRIDGLATDEDSNLPLVKLLLCQKTSVVVEGAIPVGVTAFFDAPACPERWAHRPAQDGRFLVGRPPLGKNGAFGSATPISNLEDRAHSHIIKDSVYIPRVVAGPLVCRGSGVCVDIAPGGRTAYEGQAVAAPSGLPYIQLLHCEKEGPEAPRIDSVVHAATFAEISAAPGEIVTLFGSGMGSAQGHLAELDDRGRVAAELDNVKVTFDEFPAALFFVRQDSSTL